jgi:hypothetical protein
MSLLKPRVMTPARLAANRHNTLGTREAQHGQSITIPEQSLELTENNRQA